MSASSSHNGSSQALPIHITQSRKITDTMPNRIQRVVLTRRNRPISDLSSTAAPGRAASFIISVIVLVLSR